MRPGQIQVFDGLRLTTEHLDHFQGSLHSAIQDIRGILGLGRVYSGFEVAAGEGDAVVVQPGIAFDLQKNRIVSDEPRTVPLTFAANADTAYVCAKYAQVEDHPVEGRFTLIWDETAFEVRPTPPAASDNVVALARVVRSADGSLKISASTAVPAVETPAQPAPKALRVKQGVIRIPADPAAGALTPAALAQQLRAAFSAAPPLDPGAAPQPLSLTLASADLSPGFAVTSLTCHSTLTATVEVTAAATDPAPATTGTDAPPVPAAPDSTTTSSIILAPRTSVTVRCSATGEATRDAQGLSQFGVSTCAGTTDIAELCLARLPLSLATPADASGAEVHDAVADVLATLQLTLRVASADEQRMKVICTLDCVGATDALLRTLEEHGPRLTWDSRFAWKVFGELHPMPPDPQPSPPN